VSDEVPDIVIGRLPVYLRELIQLAESGNAITTSSQDLGRRLGISSAQIRKDLSHFGEFGKQGTGYHIAYLIEQLSEILHLQKTWSVALVGAGYLGHALAHYDGFKEHGFQIACLFDNDPVKVGERIRDLMIQDDSELEKTVRRLGVEIAILAVPVNVAQEITDRLISAGVKALLSYVPVHLNVPANVRVSYSDPVVQLQRMTFYLAP
jgi:redox-sensing transcriptional repressor